MAALARFDDTPAIHCWLGARPWVERVPVHPRILRHVVMSARMGPRLTVEQGVPSDRIDVIENFVDTQRYSHVRTARDRPQSAVLYGHGGHYPDELRLLEQACADNGLSLDKVGYPYGNPRPRPEYFLPDYDIAFAIGRCALEAMASGCGVIPIVPQLAGHRITAQTLDGWAEANFAPRYYTSADRFDSDWLKAELAAWNKDDVAEVTALVRQRFTLDVALDAFEAVYVKAIAAPAAVGERAFAPYLEWLATEVDRIWGEGQVDKVELERLRDENAVMQRDLEDARKIERQLMKSLLEAQKQPVGWLGAVRPKWLQD
jgi:hypothetical protein